MKKAALYIRVSTQEQTEGYSIDAQRESLVAYAKARGIKIHDVFVDPGYSGSNLNRPGIQQLISELDFFDTVIVAKLDRLSRSQKDTLHLIEDIFIPKGKTFISISESFDTSTPFGRAMIGMLSVFAQLERENIKERMMSGRIQRARNGLYNGQKNTAIGYERTDDGEGLEIVPAEAEQVRQVFDMYLEGMAPAGILEAMIESGAQTRYGLWKNLATVTSMLSNRIYVGDVSFAGEWYRGSHDAIIDEVTFNRAQAEKARRTRPGPQRSHLLSGLLWCECGSRMAVKSAKTKKKYACYNAISSSSRMKTGECDAPSWPLNELEKIVLDEVMKIAADTEYAAAVLSQDQESAHQLPKANQMTVSGIDKQIKRLMDLYQYQGAPVDEITNRLALLSAERKRILALPLQGDGRPVFDAHSLATVLDWEHVNSVDRRNALGMLIEKIVVHQNAVDIHWLASSESNG